MKQKKRLWLLGGAITCCVGTLVWYTTVSGKLTQQSAELAQPSLARPVPTTLVKEHLNEKIRLFPGTVKASSSVELSFSVEGQLIELDGREGRQVKKGEIIAKLDPRDFINGYESSKASYLQSKTELNRAKKLIDQQVISRSEYDAAKTTFDKALAQMNISEKGKEDTIIRAPFDGVVAKRYVENNEHVKKQIPVLALKDISQIEVVIKVPENLMVQGGVETFNNIEVQFDGKADSWFSASIKEFRVQSDPVTRTYDVSVALQPPKDLEILPGMTATVKAVFGAGSKEMAKASICVIPVEAVFSESDGKSYVWRVPTTGGKPEKVRVELGSMHNDGIEVKEGLQRGERIATAGVHSITSETQVRPMKENGEGLDG